MQTLLLPAARSGACTTSYAVHGEDSKAYALLSSTAHSFPLTRRLTFIHLSRLHSLFPQKTLASSPIAAAYSPPSDDSEKAKLAQVSKRLESTSRYFKRLGGLGFWGQLVCTVVSAVILSFSVVITGKITSPVTFYATAGGIAAAFISVFWSFGYIRLSEKLRKTANDPSKAPPRADVVRSLKNWNSSQPVGDGCYCTRPVLALDVFLVQASANTILSHFLGLVFSLELLRSVTLPPSESVPVFKTA
ncbi:hypothetical protein Adt_26429 [Abeliophyllum distichum]|uniref:Protein TIC 21, chloroplastic n=1 Tax=Abeliophyllum distichum TaxID=126358 RepID=A0ABD1RRK5_9LAMI